MKLAKIILPLMDNEHRNLFFAHQALKHQLLANWGGYTSYQADGAWRDPAGKVHPELVMVYEVAMSPADIPELRGVALGICHEAKQQSVMIVTPNGDVDFIKPAEKTVDRGSVAAV